MVFPGVRLLRRVRVTRRVEVMLIRGPSRSSPGVKGGGHTYNTRFFSMTSSDRLEQAVFCNYVNSGRAPSGIKCVLHLISLK